MISPMASDKPIPDPDPYIAAFNAGEKRRREMLRELAELEAQVAQAMARVAVAAADAEARREALRRFSQPLPGGAPGFGDPSADRPTYH
jgi:multidrug resistance efflux pump